MICHHNQTKAAAGWMMWRETFLIYVAPPGGIFDEESRLADLHRCRTSKSFTILQSFFLEGI